MATAVDLCRSTAATPKHLASTSVGAFACVDAAPFPICADFPFAPLPRRLQLPSNCSDGKEEIEYCRECMEEMADRKGFRAELYLFLEAKTRPGKV